MRKSVISSIVFVLLLSIAASGCVRRVVTIDSQPQGAQVYFDRQLIGQTPCNYEFSHYGGHYLELVKEDFANLSTIVRLKGPIYEHFPLSLISEVFIPWEILDEHNFSFNLEAGQAREPIISSITQPQPGLDVPKLEILTEK